MVPDTTLRLKAVLKALDEVIEPVIPEQAALAREQLALAKKSIALVMDQIPLELAYMMRDMREDMEFARQILARLGSEDPLSRKLESAIAEGEAALPAVLPDAEAIRATWLGMKDVLQDVVDRTFADASDELWSTLGPAVIEYSEQRNLRERAWVAATGFDPEPDKLPSLREAALG
jgi:hypothetical protein